MPTQSRAGFGKPKQRFQRKNAAIGPRCRFAPCTLFLGLAILFVFDSAHAGGPLKVAGVTGFDAGKAGTLLVWPQGEVHYYTDQGDLSSLLPQASANALVAD